VYNIRSHSKKILSIFLCYLLREGDKLRVFEKRSPYLIKHHDIIMGRRESRNMASGIIILGSKWRGVSGQLYASPRSILWDRTLLIIA
jgi:hypothetical protein